MDAISYTHARNNFADTMQKVCADHTPVIITRQNAESVVMISLDDYNAMMETAYLLRSPENASRLSQSINNIKEDKFIEKDIDVED